MTPAIPETQHAVQLVGPGALKLDTLKPVPVPGPHEILAKVEAVGLCFSDLINTCSALWQLRQPMAIFSRGYMISGAVPLPPEAQDSSAIWLSQAP